MNELSVISLFSGSKGNCTLVTAGGDRILIDAGRTARAVVRALESAGCGIEEISAIFVTHEHCDHVSALPVLTKKYGIPVHMTEKSAKAMTVPDGCPLKSCLTAHDGEFSVKLSCGAEVTAFDVPHDSRECVGYRVSYSGSSVGIVTDIGYVTEKVCTMLSGCETVMIEANHDREMVRKGSYPEALKQRILSGGGHLSNSDCAALASMLCADGTKHIILAHLSEENNTPEAALEAVGKALSGSGADIVAVCGDRVTAAPCGHECESGRELIGCLT